jgi:hypothetical protein
MKDEPTPETDRIAKSLLCERADKRDYELRQHARRLECERDAERALADRLAEALLSFCSSGMVWPNTETPEKAVTAWKEARSE